MVVCLVVVVVVVVVVVGGGVTQPIVLIVFCFEVLHSFNLSEDEYHKRRTQQEYINEQNTLKTLSLEEKQRLYSYRAHLKVFCHKEKIQEQVMIATKYIERLTQQSTVVLSSVSSQKSQSSNHSIAS
jgi:hypothetical protein